MRYLVPNTQLSTLIGGVMNSLSRSATKRKATTSPKKSAGKAKRRCKYCGDELSQWATGDTCGCETSRTADRIRSTSKPAASAMTEAEKITMFHDLQQKSRVHAGMKRISADGRDLIAAHKKAQRLRELEDEAARRNTNIFAARQEERRERAMAK